MRSFILRTIIIVEDDDDDDDVLVMMLLLGFVVPSLLSPKTSLKFVFDDRGNRNYREMASSRASNKMRDDVLGHRGEHPVRVVALVFFVSETHHVVCGEEKSLSSSLFRLRAVNVRRARKR